ncbi:MAG: glutathione S-transferase family protein [Gammaproteobacteria bacterium]|nr:glutathione S-transferase family protein [Gammaproteobacteria bacterium]
MGDYELYAWAKGNALAPLLFLEESKTAYHLIPSNPESRLVAKELKKLNPWGDVPALIDRRPGKDNVSVFGSAAILCYLGFETRKLIPQAPALYASTLQWIFWQERDLHANIQLYDATKDNKIKVKCTQNLKQAFKKIDTWLKNRPYISEEFSIADIAIFFTIRNPEHYGILISEYKNIRNWMSRINNRAATKKALGVSFY